MSHALNLRMVRIRGRRKAIARHRAEDAAIWEFERKAELLRAQANARIDPWRTAEFDGPLIVEGPQPTAPTCAERVKKALGL